MSLQLKEEAEGKLVIVQVSGKLTKQDYETFTPEINTLIQKHGKVDILFRMHDFHGWDAAALWEDIKFDLKHFAHIRNLAVVGKSKWEKWMAAFCRPFTTATIKYFDQNQFDQAMTWIRMQSYKPAATPQSPAVFGIYTSRPKVEAAVEQLKGASFKNTEISVLLPHKVDRRDLVEIPTTKAIKGAEVGAGAGAIIGGVLGWLSGIGLLAVPGAGAIIVAGPIAAMLISVGTGAGLGVLLGTLAGLGIPAKEAEHFHGRLHKGDILLSVHCDEARTMQAKEIMVHTGAEDVYSRRG